MDNAKPFPEILKLYEKPNKINLKTYVLSDTNAQNTQTHKDKGHYEPFNRVFLHHEVKLRKPNPEIYYHTLKKITLKPFD